MTFIEESNAFTFAARQIERCPGVRNDIRDYEDRMKRNGLRGKQLSDALETHRKVIFTIILEHVAGLSATSSIEDIADIALLVISRLPVAAQPPAYDIAAESVAHAA